MKQIREKFKNREARCEHHRRVLQKSQKNKDKIKFQKFPGIQEDHLKRIKNLSMFLKTGSDVSG